MKRFRRLEPPPDRDDVPASERAAYDRVVDRTQRIHGLESIQAQYFHALLNSPAVADVIVRFGRLMREGQLRGTYTDVDRELVDMVLATDLRYNGILDVHVRDAIAVGVRPEAIHVVADLPRTRSGKLMRRVARAAYLGNDPGDLSGLENPAAIESIRSAAGRG